VTPRPDAVVVGAGIVGAACALALAREGLRVLVLEAGFAGGGATAAAMGHLVVMDDSAAQLALTAWSLRLWEEMSEDLPADCEYDPCGTLWLAATEDEMAPLRAKAATYGRHGVAAEVLDTASLAAAEPHLRRGLAGALRVPGDRVLYPPNAARHLLARAADHGAELRQGTPVVGIDSGTVAVRGGRIATAIVVNAAGAAAARLTPGLPIAPRKGHLVITDRYPGLCHHQLIELGYLKSAHGGAAEGAAPLHAPADPATAPIAGSAAPAAGSVAFNVQPRATGQLLIGSSRELVGWDASLNRPLLARMIRGAVAFLPALAEVQALRTWTGFRPAPPGNLPLIGAWPGMPGVWIAGGHEGLGITTSLATAHLLTSLIAGRPPHLDCAPFTPHRPAARQPPPAPASATPI
jgi:D-hydroxyproline dehydrogenase subunit beta